MKNLTNKKEALIVNQDKVSVIVPIYNVKSYLKRCVNSLLNQTYKNIEILLVDDCSTDGGEKIAKEYSEKYPQFCKFMQRQENGGLSAARNSGIENVTGDYLTFVDSDDWVHPDYIKLLIEKAIKDQADIVTVSMTYVYPNGSENKQTIEPLNTKSDQRLKIALIRSYACGRLYRSSFFFAQELRFPTNVKRAEDMGLIIPLFSRTKKTSFIDSPVYYYWQRTDSISNSNKKDMDLSFYDTAFQNVVDFVSPGFEKEIEFRAISELMYGKIMLMIRAAKKRKEIVRQIEAFNSKYPEWKKNPYISYLPRGKRIFIEISNKKAVGLLNILVWCWDKNQSIKGKKCERDNCNC